MHHTWLPPLWVCVVLIAVAVGETAIHVGEDGVLHIGDNMTDTRIAGIAISDFLRQTSLMKTENSLLRAANSMLKQQNDELRWRGIRLEYKLTASDAASGDWFGSSVYVGGDLLFVGAHGDDEKGAFSGSVYVFERNSAGGLFEQKYKLTASDASSYDQFGSALSGDRDLLFVGAILDDEKIKSSGSVYVFEKNSVSGVFEQKYKVTASDAATGDLFGYSVYVDGDVLFVGAPSDDDKGTDSGSVYVFEKNSTSGVFEQKYKLTASDALSYDQFGSALSVNGDVLFVGAIGDGEKISASGSVHVFEKNSVSGVFEQKYKLTATDAASHDRFGISVYVEGDLLFVGAPRDDDKGTDSGSVYVFEKNSISGMFEQKYKLTASDAASESQFGSSVSGDRGLLFVGAIGDGETISSSGTVYVFSLPLS